MSQLQKVSRRHFIHRAAATAGIAAPYFIPAGVIAKPAKRGANDKIGIGLIGCVGMGRGNLRACASHPDVVLTGACDVWKTRRDAVQEIKREHRLASCQSKQDPLQVMH